MLRIALQTRGLAHYRLGQNVLLRRFLEPRSQAILTS
jgi:hypothetical protein